MVVDALAASGAERGYPASIGSPAYREAAAAWMERRLGVTVDPGTELAACIGTKELVTGAPAILRLRAPDRDTVLYPAVTYPTYEMGATLAGCRAVAVPPRADGTLDLDAIDDADAARALCLWVNSPANPSGQLDDLGAAAAWGRAGACRCCPTSATSSSPGTARPARSWSTAPRASSPSTRCRSGRTWPGSGRASTPATPSSSTTCGRSASTRG